MAGGVEPYQVLKDKTDTLKATFDAYINRFVSIDFHQLIGLITELPSAYKKQVITMQKQPQPIRLQQIACITQLATELDFIYQATINKKGVTLDEITRSKKKCESLLLGAIFYRYLRLEREYQPPAPTKSVFNFYSLFNTIKDIAVASTSGEAKDNCGLYIVLRKIFLNGRGDGEDKASIDALSIVECLYDYQAYMSSPLVYNNYSYFKDNPIFLDQINELITYYQPSAEPIRTQLNYIANIKLLKDELERCEKEVKRCLTFLLSITLSEGLIADKAWILTQLRQASSSLAFSPLAINFIDQYGMNEVSEDASLPFRDRIEEIENIIETYCRYALQAVYYLTLAELEQLPNWKKLPHLTDVIHTVIGVEHSDQRQRYKTRRFVFNALSVMLAQFSDFSFQPRPDTWPDFATFQRLLSSETTDANKHYLSLKEKKNQSSSSSNAYSPS